MPGSEKVKQLIQNMALTGEIPQAILVTGERAADRIAVADLLAGFLFCKQPTPEGPCGTCASCAKIREGNYPDLIRVVHEGPDVIKVDEIRSQVADTVSVKPYYGKRKVYVIDEADLMNVQAQNSLLKTLEEPPEYCVILLLCQDASRLLPTVRSRLVRISLMEGGIRSEQEAEETGNYRLVVSLCRDIFRMAGYEAALKAKTIAAECEDLAELFDLIELWYRDALRLKVTDSVKALGFSGEKNALQAMSRQITPEGVSEVIRCVEDSRRMIRANVNKEAVVELLLMKMRETR